MSEPTEQEKHAVVQELDHLVWRKLQYIAGVKDEPELVVEWLRETADEIEGKYIDDSQMGGK